MRHISVGGKSLSAIAQYAKVARLTAEPLAGVKNRKPHPCMRPRRFDVFGNFRFSKSVTINSTLELWINLAGILTGSPTVPQSHHRIDRARSQPSRPRARWEFARPGRGGNRRGVIRCTAKNYLWHYGLPPHS